MSALQTIGFGTLANGTDGDTVKTAFTKINSNVAVAQTQSALTSATTITASQALTAAHIGKRVNLSSTTAMTINVPVASTCAADQVTLLRNLGSAVVNLAISAGSGDTLSLSKLNAGETALIDTDGVHAWNVLMRGRTNSDNETVNGNCTVGGNETVTGNMSVGGNETVSGNATVGGSLVVTGISGNPFAVSSSGAVTAASVASVGAITSGGPATVAGVVKSTSGGFTFPDGTSMATAAYGAPNGRCRLNVSSATALLLSPFDGNTVIIGGAPQVIPAAGVSLGAPAAASTLYYIYAYMSGTTMTLEASTTARATGTDGTQIKTGDATRALVGIAYSNASTQWTDSPTSRCLFSWFNRRSKSILSASNSNSTSSQSTILIGGALQFLICDGESARLSATGYTGNSSAGFYNGSNIYVDGVSIGASSIANIINAYTNAPIANQSDYTASGDGIHSMNLYASVSGGNGTWNWCYGGLIRG